MSISPAQLMMALGTADLAAETLHSTGAAARGAPRTEAPDAEGAKAQPSGPKLSTDLRIDDQRRIYYQVINNRTGDVVYEIPPGQIRKLAEGIDASLSSQLKARTLDVKS